MGEGEREGIFALSPLPIHFFIWPGYLSWGFVLCFANGKQKITYAGRLSLILLLFVVGGVFHEKISILAMKIPYW